MKSRNSFKWTDEAKDRVAELLKAGRTALQIGDEMGVSRNAICGLLQRDERLMTVGFARGTARRKKITPEERIERQREYNRQYSLRQKQGIKLPPRLPAPQRKPQRKPFKPVVVSNNVKLMVQDWIAQNGVRRFERGDMTDYYHLTNWLRERGYHLSQVSAKYFLRDGQGRPRKMTWDKVIAIVDNLRRAEGLQPIRIAS